VPEIPSIQYGETFITRTDATALVLARLLGRLPTALWDTDPTHLTVQHDLLQAVAAQMAVWLENRTIARQMTLLLEAEGLDLDALLHSYKLKRYLQRPDAYARQIGVHILYVPQGTTHALSVLADLLFALPHTTLHTGRHEVHTFVADTHPVTTPYSYWGMLSQEGLWYAVTVDHELPTISQMPPPGVNQAPGPQTLNWFTVRDETQRPWYVTIAGDTLAIALIPPAWGTGTAEPFRVLDGNAGLWELRVDSLREVVYAVLVTGSEPFAYWRVLSPGNGTYAVWVDRGTLVITLTPPAGRDETPTLAALDWFTVWDATDTSWYVSIQGDTVQLARVQPAGTGTAVPFRVLDGDGTWWGLSVVAAAEALETLLITPAAPDIPVVSPGHPFEAFQLRDSVNQPWWFSIDGRTTQLTAALPVGATDITPVGGPFRWLRVYSLDKRLWYGFPSVDGVWRIELTSPGGLGTALPQTLGNAFGVEWHFGATPDGTFATSDTPRVDLEGLSTALVLNDADGVRWFWRITGSSPFLEVSSVLWPDTVSQMPWGEISWLRLLNASGVPCYVFPGRYTGIPVVEAGPPITSYWGWSAPVPMVDSRGQVWALRVDSDNVLIYEPQVMDDIPARSPVLSLRDAVEAMGHVQAAGSLVTVLIT
jgi:hypothetical protein